MNWFIKAYRLRLALVVVGVIVVSNMTYEDEVSYDEHRQTMEALWVETNGEYGWPPVMP